MKFTTPEWELDLEPLRDMRLGFYVTDLGTEHFQYLTYRLAWTALLRKHEIFHFDATSLTYDADGIVRITCKYVPRSRYTTPKAYFEALSGPNAIEEKIDIGDLDVLMLRSDPSLSQGALAWKQTLGIQFGQLARNRGVLVVNNPAGLTRSLDKMYLQLFPESVRPRSIITRSKKDIKEFAKTENDNIILKPVQGSSGKGVFIVEKDQYRNLNQIVEALAPDGYIIAQEYLPAATAGDTRVFVMDGKPLEHKGKFAAFRRVRKGDDVRSNVHVGGKIARARITDEILQIVEKVRPRLIRDGMFLVGLDIVGTKVLEINVFCPGGLGNAQRLEGVDFSTVVIEQLERKVFMAKYYKEKWYNVDVTTL